MVTVFVRATITNFPSPQEFLNAVEVGMMDIVKVAQKIVRLLAPKASNRLKKAIVGFVKRISNRVIGIVEPKKNSKASVYAFWQEVGFGGRGNLPPEREIRAWIRQTGLASKLGARKKTSRAGQKKRSQRQVEDTAVKRVQFSIARKKGPSGKTTRAKKYFQLAARIMRLKAARIMERRLLVLSTG